MAKKPKQLTVKQAKFVKEYAENGGNGTKAAMVAYDVQNEKTASVIATENLGKPSIQEAVDAVYVELGITVKGIIEPFADGLKANRVVQVEGDFYETEVKDHRTRMDAAKTLASFIGMGRAPKEGEGGDTYNFTQVINEKGSKYND